MVQTPIGMDFDLVLDMIKKVVNAIDAYPDPQRIAVTNGPSADIASHFREPLTAAANSVAKSSEKLREELVSLDTKIRATMDDFAAQDDAAKESADQFLAILDDATQTAATPAATTPASDEGTTTDRFAK